MAEPKLLNTGKAGMEGVNVKTASEIILHASRGSNFYARQQEKQSQVALKIKEMRNQLACLSAEQISQATRKMDRLAEHLEQQRNLSRVIVHIDMDAFYAAVEMRDDPSLTKIPMAVGGSHMLCTSNYHARKYGVRAAMPGFIAKKLCPNLVIVPVNFEKYTRVGKEVQQVMAAYDPDFCSMGLDEAFLDITHLVKDACVDRQQADVDCGSCSEHPNALSEPLETREEIASKIVNEIRMKIREKTSLTASAGIAVNKMLAKICSDKNKPNGQFLLEFERDRIMQFVNNLAISKVCGIGNVTEQLLNAFDVRSCLDLWRQRGILAALFSEISADTFLRISLGLGSTTVPSDDSRKSMSVERTFRDTSDPTELKQRCKELCSMLSDDLKRENTVGKTVTLKLKTSTFHVKTRAKSLTWHTSSCDSINVIARGLLEQEIRTSDRPLKLRLMGVRMSSLLDESESSLSGAVRRQFTLDQFVCGGSAMDVDRERGQEATSSLDSVPNDIQWICPICERRVKEVDDEHNHDGRDAAFNKHIDTCLNRKAVQEVLKSEKDLYACSQKRSMSTQSRGVARSKRPKVSRDILNTSVTATIDKFLMSKKST